MHVTIIGCGQLARLMALAGKNLGVDFTFVAIDNEDTRCVESLGDIVFWSKQESARALLQVISNTDVVTVEREDLDKQLLMELSMRINVYPRPEIVSICQNRLQEKLALTKLGIPCTPWLSVTDKVSARNAVSYFDYPVIVKSLEQGYDGKNQWRINSINELSQLCLNSEKIDWIIEPVIEFEREVSLIGVRSPNGEIKFYSPAENKHINGVLRTSIAPANSFPNKWLKEAENNLRLIMENWDYVGVLAMELFVTRSGLLVNELAPRVHNSGHWTQEGSKTSQFENHIRAVLNLPLGETENVGFAAMVNILGRDLSKENITIPKAKVELYNKVARPGRKLGHVNIVEAQRHLLLENLAQVESTIYS